jgi:hypothetical protein
LESFANRFARTYKKLETVSITDFEMREIGTVSGSSPCEDIRLFIPLLRLGGGESAVICVLAPAVLSNWCKIKSIFLIRTIKQNECHDETVRPGLLISSQTSVAAVYR